MFCGLCVEACPYDALFMGSGFEQGRYSRKDMVITIDELRQADKHPSAFFPPQLEDQSYDPRSGQPLDWTQVGRESWRWHEREKAGMRLGSRPTPAYTGLDLPGPAEENPSSTGCGETNGEPAD